MILCRFKRATKHEKQHAIRLSLYSIFVLFDSDYLFKIIVIGDASTGKSSLVTRFTDDKFSAAQVPTIGVDFVSGSLFSRKITNDQRQMILSHQRMSNESK